MVQPSDSRGHEIVEWPNEDYVEPDIKIPKEVEGEWLEAVLDRWVLYAQVGPWGTDLRGYYAADEPDFWLWIQTQLFSLREFCERAMETYTTFETEDAAWEEARRIDPILWEKAMLIEDIENNMPPFPLLIDDMRVMQVREMGKHRRGSMGGQYVEYENGDPRLGVEDLRVVGESECLDHQPTYPINGAAHVIGEPSRSETFKSPMEAARWATLMILGVAEPDIIDIHCEGTHAEPKWTHGIFDWRGLTWSSEGPHWAPRGPAPPNSVRWVGLEGYRIITLENSDVDD